jgi:hypothetical protein
MSLAMNHQPVHRPATYQDVIDAPADKVWTLAAALADDAEVRLAPFDAIAFPLADLWAE